MNAGDEAREQLRALTKVGRLLEPFSVDIRRRILTTLVMTYGAEQAVIDAQEMKRRTGYSPVDHRRANPGDVMAPDGGHWYGWRERRRKALYRDPDLCAAIRQRDKDQCRYCGTPVVWDGGNQAEAGTYDHIDAKGPNTLDNVCVSCRRCNIGRRGQRVSADDDGMSADISGDVSVDVSALGPPVFLASTASEVRAQKGKTLHELLRIYEELFTCKYGERPLISSGKDPKLLSRILKLYGSEKTEELLAEFFETDDGFVLKSGHTIGVFSSVVNKLIAERAKRHEVPPDLSQPIEWGAPGCLLQLWNQATPEDCTSIDCSPGLLSLERQALRRFPNREWWAGVFQQIPESPYLLGKVKPPPGRPGRTRAIDIAWLLGVTPEGVEHAFQVYHGHYLRTS
jgi:hypothetical protein